MIDCINKIIFIHIPRTGGSQFSNHYYNDVLSDEISVDTYTKYCSYGDFDAKHFRYRDYKHFIGPKINEYKTVTVIRNSYDLAVSNWRMHLRNFNDYNERHKNFVKDFPSFVSWLELQKDKSEQDKNHSWLTPYESMRQKTYLNGAPDCEIIRYESYNAGVYKFFKNHFNIETNLRRLTDKQLKEKKEYKNRKINYKEYYNPKLEERIYNLYSKEINNYKFTL
tara:strand:- start:138 stop:806 length:669 start_codon:yes stop_codon:yes gene_type:complete